MYMLKISLNLKELPFQGLYSSNLSQKGLTDGETKTRFNANAKRLNAYFAVCFPVV